MPAPNAAELALTAVAERLRVRGERMTGPRRAVLRVLAGAPGHLSVEQVAELVAATDPSVHLASVYRSLEAFERLGIVQHVHLGHGSTAYHLVGTIGAHPHAQCRVCRAVLDVSPDVLEQAARLLAAEHDFQLDPTHAALSGICGDCRTTGRADH